MWNNLMPHIVERFERFHQENPQVYELVKKYATEARQAGVTSYGIAAIIERIRWHVRVETRGDVFKINNNWASCYARKLIQDDPSFEKFFNLRQHKGQVPS